MRRSVILLALLPVAATSCIYAQRSESQLVTQRPAITDWKWVSEEWTGDETPFVKIKGEIDRVAEKQNLANLAKKYKSIARSKPRDAKAQYAWAYAAVIAPPAGASINRNDVPIIALALAQPLSPKSYHYSRARFLATMKWLPYLQLKGLGRRLLQRDSNDYEVKYYLINLLVVGSSAEQQEALAHAQSMVHAYPKRASAYASLGWAYNNIFLDQNNIAAGDKAIAAYREFLRLSGKPNQEVERFIKLIQQEQARLRRLQKR